MEVRSPGSFSSCSSGDSPPRDFTSCPPDQALRKRSSELSLARDSPVTEGMKRSNSTVLTTALSTCMMLEEHMRSKFEGTMSIKPDEALAYALQEQELRRFK